MSQIVYYVASSVDGYIGGKDGGTDMFPHHQDAVDLYFNDLKAFGSVMMGRRTYEAGYEYGLVPGQPAYSHMKHYIVSASLDLPDKHENVSIIELDLATIDQVKREASTDIYLCGGGELAGWLLDRERIDVLKVKVNPILIGDGIRLFGNSSKNIQLEQTACTNLECGIFFITYSIKY
jgi:dihydrofolate reductase